MNQLRVLVEEALQNLKDPDSGLGLIEARLASGLVVKDDGRVAFMIEIPPHQRDLGEALRQKAEAAVAKVNGVTKVTAVLTAHEGNSGGNAGPPRPSHKASGQQSSKIQVETRKAPPPRGVRLSNEAVANATPQPAQNLALPPGVKAIIAVSSAKGGVGKSTIAVNLAVAMARLGKRVGILDADIYGPSVPRLLGLTGADPKKTGNGKIAPPEAWGVFAMSIGFMVDDDAPLIWRGPIVTGALMQFLNDVDWTSGGAEAAPLDVLVLDMPPGTGDIQLTILQRIPIAGAVIVSTPQEIALADVRRGLAMFKKTAAPILGIVENMAWFEDSSGAKVHVFGQGGAERTAKEAGVPFLGALPLIADIGATSDSGQPIAATAPDSVAGKYFEALALKVLEGVETGVGLKPPPRISFVN